MKKHWVAMVVLAGLALAATESDAAKRAGGGKDSGTQRPAATKDDDVKTKRTSSAPTISINRSGSSSPSTAQPSVAPAVAAGAAGATVGAAMATSARPAGAAAPSPEEVRKAGEAKLKQAIEEEEKAKAAEEKKNALLADRDKQEAEEKRKVAKLEAEKKAKVEKERRESLCQFKPVMTDQDIANCRAAYGS